MLRGGRYFAGSGSAAAPAAYPPRPRDTRSISARTRRSTIFGRLSSSHALSIGRSISRTKSSSVREFCTSTVWASELKAESTAAVGDDDKSERSGRAVLSGRPPDLPAGGLDGRNPFGSRRGLVVDHIRRGIDPAQGRRRLRRR